MQIWIHAPQGFRPSNWVDMLRDIDVAFELDPHLVDPCFITVNQEKHYVLFVMCSLLDEGLPQAEVREALFQEMMAKAASLGLKVTVPHEFAATYPRWWSWLEPYCREKRIELNTHEAVRP